MASNLIAAYEKVIAHKTDNRQTSSCMQSPNGSIDGGYLCQIPTTAPINASIGQVTIPSTRRILITQPYSGNLSIALINIFPPPIVPVQQTGSININTGIGQFNHANIGTSASRISHSPLLTRRRWHYQYA